jgi:hypothetical protein
MSSTQWPRVENRRRLVRDVTLGEDAGRMRSRPAPARLRGRPKTALNLLRGAGHPRIASAPPSCAAKATEALGLFGLSSAPNEKPLRQGGAR